jgi:hypothetical protein
MPRSLALLARWTVTSDAPTWSQPCLVGSRLYVKDRSHVLCFELSDE